MWSTSRRRGWFSPVGWVRIVGLSSLMLVMSPPAEAGLLSLLSKVGKMGSAASKATKVAKVAKVAKVTTASKVIGAGSTVTKIGLTAMAADRSLFFLASLPNDLAHGAAVLARTDDGLQVFTAGGHFSVVGSLDDTLGAARATGSPATRLYVDASALDDVPAQLPTGVTEAYMTDVAGGAHPLSRADDGRWWVEVDGGDLVDLVELSAELSAELVPAEEDAAEAEDPESLPLGVQVASVIGAGLILVIVMRQRRPTLRPATPEEEAEQRRLRGQPPV